MTDTGRIAHLEAEVKRRDELLRGAWALFSDAYLCAETPDTIRRSRAFCRLDATLRAEGIVGPAVR